jgi:hypothetical protein
MMRDTVGNPEAMRRAGGIGGLLYAGATIGEFLLKASVYSSAHLDATKGDLTNAARILPAVARQPMGFLAISAMNVLLGIAVALLALGLRRQLENREGVNPRLVLGATAAGFLSAALYFGQGVFDMIRLPQLASDYPHHPAAAASGLQSYAFVSDLLLGLATVAFGIWLVTVCWIAIRTKVFPRWLNYIGFFWGVLALLALVEVTLLLLVGEVLGLIWAIWIGVFLLREGRAPAAAAPEPARR